MALVFAALSIRTLVGAVNVLEVMWSISIATSALRQQGIRYHGDLALLQTARAVAIDR